MMSLDIWYFYDTKPSFSLAKDIIYQCMLKILVLYVYNDKQVIFNVILEELLYSLTGS